MFIRKLAAFETVEGETVLLLRSTRDLLTAVRRASTLPLSPSGILLWMEAMDYLCASPSAFEMLAAVQRGLLVPLSVIPSMYQPARADLTYSRTVLDESAAEAGRTPQEIADLQAIGYDLNPDPVAPQQRAQCDPLTEAECEVALSCVLSLGVGSHPKDVLMTASLGRTAALGLLARCQKGAKQVLGCIDEISGNLPPIAVLAVAQAALRTLYCLECAGSQGTLLPIRTVSALRKITPTAACAELLLPLLDGQPAVAAAMSPTETSRWPPASATTAELREELKRRVPWLQKLRTHVVFYVTGSLLTESIARPGGSDQEVGDVDLFCLDEEGLAPLANEVRRVMRDVEPVRMSGTRWRLEGGQGTASKCDVYVNSVERVRTYHLPLVRSAYCWTEDVLYMYPSCCLALATGYNVDFTYFGGKKTAFDILARKFLSGHTLVLNPKERYQLEVYMRCRQLHQDVPARQVKGWTADKNSDSFAIEGRARTWREVALRGYV